MGGERRRAEDRRRRDRRARLTAIQANHDDLIETVARNAEEIKRLEGEQRIQLKRIAQIQLEIDSLKKLL
jgi:hypothetical protein